MTERYINGVPIDPKTWNKVKEVQEIIEKRDRRAPRLPRKRRGGKL
jgi:hypothetical protein